MSVPGVPSQFVGNYTIKNNYIDFSWNAPSGEVLYYYIYYYPSVGIGNTLIIPGTNQVFRFKNLSYGLSYRFRISASNQYGESDLSDYTPSFSIIGLPGPPYNVSGYSRPGETNAYISWFPPNNLLGSTIIDYTVRMYIKNTIVSIFQTNANSPSAYFQDLSFGTIYNFSVAALTDAGMTRYSLLSSDFTLSPSYPSPPTNVVAVSNHDLATVSWTASNSHGSPILYYTVVDIFNNIQIRTTDASTTLDIPNLEFNKTYYFQVYAKNAFGQSLYSSPSTTFILTNTIPDPPTRIQAFSVPGTTTATVSWTPGSSNGSDIISYTLSFLHYSFNVSIPSIVLYDLSFHTFYSFTVVATNGIGTSAPSLPSDPFSLTPTIPDVPTDLVATSIAGSTTANLSWTQPYSHGSTITSYYILITPSYGSPYIDTVEGNLSTEDVPFLLFGVVYSFAICAVSDIGNSAYSVPVKGFVLFGPPTAPYDLLANINPNPTETPSIQLFWNPPLFGLPIVSYQIIVYIDGDSKGIINNPSTNTNILIQYLSYNTSYEFQVQATNQYGSGPVSNKTSSIIIPYKAPVFPPTNVRGVINPGYTNAIILWNDPTGDVSGLPIVSHSILLTDITAGTFQQINI